MKKFINLIFIVALGVGFTIGILPSASAQESAIDEFTLEEITVTAQKREENLQKVAIPIEVISGEDLVGTGKNDIEEILQGISGVLINSAVDGMRVSLRGIANEDSPQNDITVAQPTVAINVDGAYDKSGAAGMNLFDIERIEVLMGPQSTMYSNTSPGGIVNIVTAAPKTDKYSASGTVEVGNFSRFMAQAMVNVPVITDKFAMRIAANWEKRDPYVVGDNQVGEDTKMARLKYLWQPNDKLSVTVTGNYSKKIGGGMFGGEVMVFDYQDGYWAQQPQSEKPYEVVGPVTNPWTEFPGISGGGGGGGPPPNRPGGPNKGNEIKNSANGEIEWDTGLVGSLSVYPQYSTTSSNDSSSYQNTEDLNYYRVYTKIRKHQKGVEARMTSDPDFFFKWMVAYSFYKDKSVRHSEWTDPDQVPGSTTHTQDNKAIFGNVTYPITDKFRGSVGYRKSWDEVDSINIPAKGGPGGGFAAPVSYSNPDYSLAVEYDLAPNSMLYANYATSYRMNAVKLTQSKDTPPEKMTAYTLGIKNRLFENKLQLNADLYYYDYKNKNSRVTNDGRLNAKPFTVYASWLTGPDGVTPYSDILGYDIALTGQYMQDDWVGQGGGEFTTIGTDISADWIITSNDKLYATLAYIDSKWEDMLISFYWKNWTAAGTAATGLTGHVWGDEGKNLAGRQVTYSPTWSGTLGYEHNFDLGSFGFLTPHIDLMYKSKYTLDYEDIYYPYDRQEAYYTINANATFNHASGKWTLNAYVRNATNYAAKTFWHKQAGVFGLGISNPRTFGVVLSLKY